MVNTLETSQAVNNSIDTTGLGDESTFIAESFSDPYHEQSLTALVDAWLPITFAINSINRSKGQLELYPFVHRQKRSINFVT
jgi:hypothetical protein